MGKGVHQRHVGARPHRQMVLRLHMGGARQGDAPRVGDDEPCAFTQPPLHPGGEHRVPLRGVGADHQDDVRLRHGVEVLRAGRGAEGAFQAVAGGGVAHPSASVHVVVAERRTHQLLHGPDLLVGAARRRDAAHRALAVPRLHGLDAVGREGDGLVPRHRAPRIARVFTDHGLGDAVAMLGVAPGVAPLHAGVAVVRQAVLVWRHAHHPVALHFGLERATDAAVGAGGLHHPVRHAVFDDGFVHERGGGAGIHAGAARHTFGAEEILAAGGDGAGEAAPVDGERVGALHLFAGAHTARADNALRGVEGEVGVRGVCGRIEVVLAGGVAHFAQTDGAGHVLQFAVAVRGTGEAVEGVIGDVEFHHAAPQFGDGVVLRRDGHALGDRLRAGGVEATPPFDFHQAQAAGAESRQAVRGAELGHRNVGGRGGAHDGGAGRHGHFQAIDGEAHLLRRHRGRCAEVHVAGFHGVTLALNWRPLAATGHCAPEWASCRPSGRGLPAP